MTYKAIMAAVMAWVTFPILIAVIIAFKNNKQLDKKQKQVAYLVVFALIVQLISYGLWLKAINNLPLLHLYTAVELVLIVLFYRSWTTSEIAKKRLNWLAITFVGLAILNVLFFQSIYKINAHVRGLESLIIIVLSLIYWMKIMRELDIDRLVNSSLFWFNTAFLIYFSVNFILFLFSGDLNELTIDETIKPWLVHCFFMTIYYFLLAVGLWKKPVR